MILSRMKKWCGTELAIVLILLNSIADAQVYIPAITAPNNGDTVILTCIISTFTMPAAWKNNDSGAHITTCFNNGTCTPSSDGVRYNFRSTSSYIIVTISSFNSAVDTFTWKCEHSGNIATYRITVAMTRQSTAQSTLTSMAGNTGNRAKQQRPFPMLVLLVSVLLVLCSLF